MYDASAVLGPYREEYEIVKWAVGADPTCDEPEETLRFVTWYDMDGTEITDEARIAALEEQVQQKSKE